jgi:hypothetical protein
VAGTGERAGPGLAGRSSAHKRYGQRSSVPRSALRRGQPRHAGSSRPLTGGPAVRSHPWPSRLRPQGPCGRFPCRPLPVLLPCRLLVHGALSQPVPAKRKEFPVVLFLLPRTLPGDRYTPPLGTTGLMPPRPGRQRNGPPRQPGPRSTSGLRRPTPPYPQHAKAPSGPGHPAPPKGPAHSPADIQRSPAHGAAVLRDLGSIRIKESLMQTRSTGTLPATNNHAGSDQVHRPCAHADERSSPWGIAGRMPRSAGYACLSAWRRLRALAR